MEEKKAIEGEPGEAVLIDLPHLHGFQARILQKCVEGPSEERVTKWYIVEILEDQFYGFLVKVNEEKLVRATASELAQNSIDRLK